MLSEKQDTFTIFSWLTRWKNNSVVAPQETICDFSMTLLGAISQVSYGGITLRDYVETCIDILNDSIFPRYQLQCYIRIDIVHTVKMFCR